VVISLTLNLLLGAACWFGWSRAPKPAAGVSATSALPQPPVQVVQRTVTNIVAVAAPPRLLDWRTVESPDYKQYLANLRGIGCPEKTIRDVIVADVNELYRQRYREFFPPTNRVEYWKPGNPLANLMDETSITKQNELRQEKRDLLKTLLGSTYNDEEDLSAIQLDSFSERLLNFLTPEKRTAMKELEDTFSVRMMKTYKDTWRGNEGPADAVKAEKDEAALKVLTPEEKFEYDLRRSDTAMFLRVGLGGFEVSEQEFRAIYPEIKKFVADAGKPGFGAMIRGEPDPRPEGGAARVELQAKLKRAMGDDRFSQFIEQTHWNLKAEEPQQ
jgi:hypothetical protein